MRVRTLAEWVDHYRTFSKEEILSYIPCTFEGNAVQLAARGLPADTLEPYEKYTRVQARDYLARLHFENHTRTADGF